MKSLLQQLKKQRLVLGLKQNDMMLRVGVSRQQYQRLESKGNPRLDTLELVAKGLNSEIMLIPKEKLNAVLAVLEEGAGFEGVVPKNTVLEGSNSDLAANLPKIKEHKSLSEGPWQGLLGDDL